MSRTLADVVQNVRTELDRGAEMDDVIVESIRRTVQRHRARKLGFNEVRRGASVSAEYVTLGADVLEVTRLVLDESSQRWPMLEVPAVWIEEQQVGTLYTGRPCYFATERDGTSRQVRLYPAPNKTYSAQFGLVVDLASEVSWTDNMTLAWFDDAYLVVLYETLSEIHAAHLGGPEAAAEAQRFAVLADRARADLIAEARLFQHSDSIKPVW